MSNSRWLWIVILILLLILVIYWFLDPLGDTPPVPAAPPTAPSSEWIASPVGEEGVPVTLPTTNVTAVPEGAASPAQ